MPKADKTPPKVAAAAKRSADKALREERVALAAITKVMLLECPEPARVLSRLDAMVRAANGNPRVPAGTRRALLDGTRFVRAALAKDGGKQDGLFDPATPVPKPAEVAALVTSTDGPSQLGLDGQGSFLGDVETAHAERVDTIGRVHQAVIELIKERGPMVDRELWERYAFDAHSRGWPPQSPTAVADRRKELTAAGRLVGAGLGKWDLVERAEVTA